MYITAARTKKNSSIFNETYKEIRRGDIYYADLGSTLGSEQGGIRPVVIIQNNAGNRYSPTTIACPITKQSKKTLPTHAQVYFNGYLNTILGEQVRTISKERLQNFVGHIDEDKMTEVNNALSASLMTD